MSLFPAYASSETKSTSTPEAPSASSALSWLANASFTPDPIQDSQLFSTFKDNSSWAAETLPAVETVNDSKTISKPVDEYESKHRKSKKKKTKDVDERVRDAAPPKSIFIHEQDRRSLKDKILIDRKCDRNHLVFGSLAPIQIAKYSRKRPLTASGDYYKRGNFDKISARRYFAYHERLRDEYVTENISTPKITWESFGQNSGYYFLPLEVPEIKENESNEEQSVKLTKTSSAILHQRLHENPHDVQLWLQFLKSQSDFIDIHKFIDSESTGNKRDKMVESVILERKLAIVDKAIEHNPKSVELITYKFNLCKDVWDTDKLTSEWKKLLFIHPNNTFLWQQYLQFFQTKFSSFTVSKFVKLNTKCFSTLTKILEGTFQSHVAQPYMEEQVISIFSNYCNLLYQSGYQEKAVASFQALIEFNFFAPEHLTKTSISLEDKIAFFEPFWDSGVPRFGEESAPGWANTMTNKQIHYQKSDSTDLAEEDEAIRATELKWRNWLRLEKVRGKNSWLPWLPKDEEDSCEDSERMVVVDDVVPTLFNIKEINNRFLLIVQFLKFLGASGFWYAGSCCESLQRTFNGYFADTNDIVAAERFFRWKFYTSSRASDSIPLEPSAIRSGKLDNVINTVFEKSVVLFKNYDKYRRLITLFWIRWKVSKISTLATDQEKRTRVKEVKKFIKNLLKLEDNRHDYDLWIEHCLFEIRSGNVDEARKVFDVLINSHTPWDRMTKEEKSAVYNIYEKYATCELNIVDNLSESNRTKLLRLLSSLADAKSLTDKTAPSPSAILKARVRYKTLIDQELKIELDNENLEQLWCTHYSLVSLVICYSVFEYLTLGITAAEDAIRLVISSLEAGMKPWTETADEWLSPTQIRLYTILESLYIQWLQLNVIYNNNEASAPLSLIRNVLSQALKMFPNNIYFNHLLLDIEGKSQLGMRLRKHYNDRLRESCSADLTSAIFALVGEMERMRNIIESQDSDRLSYATGITHRLRALFESSVKHHQLRHSVLIWRLYLQFEALQGHLKNCKAVFYRALQQCPWAKILYVDAVQLFPEDLQDLHDLMTEKEIRIMAPLEEVALLLDLQRKSEQLPNSNVKAETSEG
ncbi:Protein nrde2 [Chamberlinius hualienensis]